MSVNTDQTTMRFYRIVQSDPPRRYDFTSNEERGMAPRRPLSPRDRDRWRGVSVYSSAEAAADKARASPRLGDYIAEIIIPEGRIIRVEQTGREPAHYAIWADADDLLSWVASVVPRHEVE